MTRRSTILLGPALAVPAVALAIAGCGGNDGSTVKAAPPAATASSGGALVGVRDSALGKILVDAQGRTLYLFERDSGGKSACVGACAATWPPLTTGGAPRAAAGASASLLATIPRPDGAREVTYKGRPLYSFAGDQAPGETNGQGTDLFGGEWYALAPDGSTIVNASGSATPTASVSGY